MLRNCINCGQVHTLPAKMCKECRKKEKEVYQKVKNFLWENPNSTIDNIHENTGVPRNKIIQYLREGRFMITAGSVDADIEKESKSDKNKK